MSPIAAFWKLWLGDTFRGTANGSDQPESEKTWIQPPAAHLGSLIRSVKAWQTLDTDLCSGGPGWILILTFFSLGKREYWGMGMKDPSLFFISSSLVTSTGSWGIQSLLILTKDKENLGMVLCASWADDSRIIIPFLCGCSACWDHPTEVLHCFYLHRDKIPGALKALRWGEV